MIPVKKIKKQTYLLLELLIAVGLLSLFLGPMLNAPFKRLTRQKKEILSLLLQMEGERLFFQVEEDLRTGAIPEDLLFQKGVKKVSLPQKEREKSPSFLASFLPKTDVSVSFPEVSFKQLENGTRIGVVEATLEMVPAGSPKKTLYKKKSVFFIAQKQQDLPVNPSFGDVRESICRGGE